MEEAEEDQVYKGEEEISHESKELRRRISSSHDLTYLKIKCTATSFEVNEPYRLVMNEATELDIFQSLCAGTLSERLPRADARAPLCSGMITVLSTVK